MRAIKQNNIVFVVLLLSLLDICTSEPEQTACAGQLDRKPSVIVEQERNEGGTQEMIPCALLKQIKEIKTKADFPTPLSLNLSQNGYGLLSFYYAFP